MIKTLLSRTENGSKSKKLEGEFSFSDPSITFLRVKFNLIHILLHNSTLNNRANSSDSTDSSLI